MCTANAARLWELSFANSCDQRLVALVSSCVARVGGHTPQDCMRKHFCFLAFTLAFSCHVFAATGKLEPVAPPKDSSVAQSVWQALSPNGYRVLLPDGSTVCDIWLRQSLPGTNKKETEGVLFPEIGESTLVGVISFPKATTDFRGDPVPAGFYTLRYALIPNDGNHLGVSQNRDFLLLVPAGSDSDPGAQYKFQELVRLSSKTSNTKHPGPLSMVQADTVIPGVADDDQGHTILSVKVPLSSGDELPIGLIVKGTAAQ